MKRDLATILAEFFEKSFHRILGDVNCIYVMQRKIYNVCMNDDMQRKIYNLYIHELCIVVL